MDQAFRKPGADAETPERTLRWLTFFKRMSEGEMMVDGVFGLQWQWIMRLKLSPKCKDSWS